MFVKPRDGLSVRCPVKGVALPKNGAEVPDNTFWRRRLNDGDVVRTSKKMDVLEKGVSPNEEGETE